MSDTATLYRSLGELLYAVAMADGVIQESEQNAIQLLLRDHKWAEEIEWSFTHDVEAHPKVDTAYERAIAVCKKHGPSPLYAEFIAAMEIVADASLGIDPEEDEVIQLVAHDLVARFQEDVEM